MERPADASCTPVELIETGDSRDPALILAHGAGAGMRSDFMNWIAETLSADGVRVLRFEFPYMAARRDGKRRGPDRQDVLIESLRTVVESIKPSARNLFIGGKSLGGRIASMIVDQTGADGLICLGYPFHPPGQPQKLRTAHLSTLRTPTLIVQGERDPFGAPLEIASYDLSASIAVELIPDGDHSFKPRKRSGHTLESNLEHVARSVTSFIRSRAEHTD